VTAIHKAKQKLANEGIKSINIGNYLILTYTAIMRNIMNTALKVIVGHSKASIAFIAVATP